MNHISHLTDQQIERYVREIIHPPKDDRQFEAHIAQCESCRLRLLEAERNSLGLRGPVKRSVAGSGCPSEDGLQAFAAGVCNPGDTAIILDHVAGCDHCAPLLQEYLAAIQEDLEVEEEPGSDPDPSPSAVIRARTRLIKMSSAFKTIGETYRLHPVFAKASLAGGALLFAGIFALPPAFNAYALHKADTSISAAAREAAFKMRLNWAPHPQAALLKDPTKPPSAADNPSLSVATGLAANKQHLTDPRWIRFRGRVKLVLGEYEDSAKLLELATEMGLNDPETRIDLAVADFQRDSSSGSSPDAGRASAGDREKSSVYLSESFELLTKVLKDPRLTPAQRATATFDLAMVYQQMQLWDEAVLTWEKYLQLDTAGAWHDDALRSLEEAKKKSSPAKPQGYRSPNFFLQHSSDPSVLAGLEEYVDIALQEWLPEIDNKDGYESLAFGKLAQLMHDQHGDLWMRDFLLARRVRDGPALIALSKAVNNNKIGRYSEARHQAQEAENLFAALQQRPGQLRARFEAVYADQRLLVQKNCLKNAQALHESLLHTPYQWLQAQTALELAACLNFANRTQTAKEQVAQARQIATASNFPILALRVQGWNAGIDLAAGDYEGAWNKTQIGLAQYWQGPKVPLRLYEFYSYLKLCLVKKKLWDAAESLERRMITILEKEIDRQDENVALEVTAHRSLEQILNKLDETEEAADEAKLALRLLGRVEPDIVVKYSSQIKFELADLQLDRNDAEAAWATIREVEKEVLTTGNELLLLTFLRIRGDVNFRRQMPFDAEVDYKQGIEIAESAILRNQTEEQRRNRMEETGDLYRGLVQVYIQQNREQEALKLWEWYQTRSLAMGDEPIDAKGPPKWSDIERAVLNQPLPAGATPRLVYVSTRDKLLVWTFGASGTNIAELPVKREELQRRIREYVRKIGREQREGFPLPAPEAESKELFALVLQPVLAGLPRNDPAANPVVVDFDSAMSGLPVEALMSSEGWYFGQRFPVIYSPGYVQENALREYSLRVPAPGLVIDALGNQGAIAKFKELVSPAVIIDDQDGRPGERESLLAQSAAFVFAGHGKSGALLLGNGKPLKAEDFPQQSLANMQLAVLVACSSGVAREGLLDTGSLIDAFQNGGTPAVVASQWNVAADFTGQFMDGFFSNMKKGDSPAQALFEARKQLFRVKSHPYYWAAFTLSGRP